MKILLLSAYNAESHQYWHSGLVENFPQYQWQVLTLPGRYFSWRIRGNSMSWAFGKDAHLLRQDYDLVIATSMTDLSSLRGFVPTLANTPSLVYFHENQFAYPESSKARANVEPQILNLYTALAADKLAFNSEYNYRSFIQGAAQLLRKLPDQVPSDIIERIEQKSTVLAVPLKSISQPDTPLAANISWQCYSDKPIGQRPVLISWAARWEYDKGPDRLLSIIQALEESGIDYRLCILGQSFRQVPKAFHEIEQYFKHRLDQFGYADSQAEYFEWLKCSDFFLSTAEHEFQGLAVLEAVSLGCVPLLPDRLVYPELFDQEYLYQHNSEHCVEAQSFVTLLKTHISALAQSHQPPQSLKNRLHQFHWDVLKADYSRLIKQCLHSGQ